MATDEGGRGLGDDVKAIKRHLILIGLLLLSNGCLAFLWAQEAGGTDRFGRQWLRVLMPLWMIVSSGIIMAIYSAVRGAIRRTRRRPRAGSGPDSATAVGGDRPT